MNEQYEEAMRREAARVCQLMGCKTGQECLDVYRLVRGF